MALIFSSKAELDTYNQGKQELLEKFNCEEALKKLENTNNIFIKQLINVIEYCFDKDTDEVTRIVNNWDFSNDGIIIYKGDCVRLEDICEEVINLAKFYGLYKIERMVETQHGIIIGTDNDLGYFIDAYKPIFGCYKTNASYTSVDLFDDYYTDNESHGLYIDRFMTRKQRVLHQVKVDNSLVKNIDSYLKVLEELYVEKEVYELDLHDQYSIMLYILKHIEEGDVFGLNHTDNAGKFKCNNEDIRKAVEKALELKEIIKLVLNKKNKDYDNILLSNIYEGFYLQPKGQNDLFNVLHAIDKCQKAIGEGKELDTKWFDIINNSEKAKKLAYNSINSYESDFLSNCAVANNYHNICCEIPRGVELIKGMKLREDEIHKTLRTWENDKNEDNLQDLYKAVFGE